MYIYPDCICAMTNLSRSKSLGSLNDADQLKLCVEENKGQLRTVRKRSSPGECKSPKKKVVTPESSPEFEETSFVASPQRMFGVVRVNIVVLSSTAVDVVIIYQV